MPGQGFRYPNQKKSPKGSTRSSSSSKRKTTTRRGGTRKPVKRGKY